VARFLEASGRCFYLPQIPRTSLIRGRKFTAQVPLFPGYLFLKGQREDAFAAVSTKRVCQILEVADQDRFESEIAHVAGALEGGAALELYPFAVVGSRCRVIKGPFMGIEGWILERTSSTRLVLQVSVLGQGAALEIDTDFLEPID